MLGLVLSNKVSVGGMDTTISIVYRVFTSHKLNCRVRSCSKTSTPFSQYFLLGEVVWGV